MKIVFEATEIRASLVSPKARAKMAILARTKLNFFIGNSRENQYNIYFGRTQDLPWK
jgi:hypothetical protein